MSRVPNPESLLPIHNPPIVALARRAIHASASNVPSALIRSCGLPRGSSIASERRQRAQRSRRDDAHRVVRILLASARGTAPATRRPTPAAPAPIPCSARRSRAGPRRPCSSHSSDAATDCSSSPSARLRRAVPPFEDVGGPRERLVEMTQVAGVRSPGRERRRHRRAADLMAADRLQQPVGRVRHVAVVAGAAGRSARWCGMSRSRSRARGMHGTRRCRRARRELIVGPVARPRGSSAVLCIVWHEKQVSVRRARRRHS